VHARERAHDFEVAELLRADIHKHVLAFRVVAVQPLDGVLHRCCQPVTPNLFSRNPAGTCIRASEVCVDDFQANRAPDLAKERRARDES
jgi:hypothetical protein